MVLYRLVHEVPLQKIETVIQISPGRIQSLQKDAAYFCHMVILFCKKLNWLFLANALTPYTNRLSFGVHEELVSLVRVGTEIPAFRARALYRNGIKCPKDILDAGKEKLLEILQSIVPFESDDPLNAAIFEKSKSYSCTNQSSTENQANFKPQTNSATMPPDLHENLQRKSKLDQERWLMSCERLANKILSRVKTYMKEEQNSLEIIKNLRGAI
jgi:replicative superfamily II helicase